MDYVEAFKNLRTNNKWGRKSPHKAVLMLTVIELYEKNVLTDNEIYYDDTLKDTFREVWNRVLPEEPKFHSDACLPFWYLQSDSFWHIVPKRGQEDILSLMRDNNVKPSEAKLYDSVKYAELDDDLYFLMTIPSGRSS
jgi:predicted restriction endonuclease